MTVEQWDRRQVPALYVRQTIDAARKSMREQKKQLAKASAEPRREGLGREIERLERRLADLAEAVGRDDRGAASSVARALRVDLNLTSPAPGSEGGQGL